MRWEGREPFLSDAITTLGSNKAACLLRLNFAKVSSTKDLLNRQTCEGILCLRLVTSQYPPGRIPSDSYSHTILRVSPVPCCGVMMCVATVPLSPARSDCLALSFRRHPASRHLIEATTSLQAPAVVSPSFSPSPVRTCLHDLSRVGFSFSAPSARRFSTNFCANSRFCAFGDGKRLRKKKRLLCTCLLYTSPSPRD